MAISPQRLTIYLYSAHRAVIFAIAQLSCYVMFLVHTPNQLAERSSVQADDLLFERPEAFFAEHFLGVRRSFELSASLMFVNLFSLELS